MRKSWASSVRSTSPTAKGRSSTSSRPSAMRWTGSWQHGSVYPLFHRHPGCHRRDPAPLHRGSSFQHPQPGGVPAYVRHRSRLRGADLRLRKVQLSAGFGGAFPPDLTENPAKTQKIYNLLLQMQGRYGTIKNERSCISDPSGSFRPLDFRRRQGGVLIADQ